MPGVEIPVDQPSPTPTSAPVYPKPCGDLYDPEILPVFELELDPGDWSRMESEYLAGVQNWYGPVTFRYGDEVRTDVMIRPRGNNSRCKLKLQVAIDFNNVDPDARFHGVRRISLDHGGWSCKMIEERVALAWMREDLGLPVQCANQARLFVNGTYYGLYTNLEHMDREFLERNFPDPDGNLYEGHEKKTNESDPDDSDLEAFWDAATAEELDAISDMDEIFLGWAAEAAIPARDNFWMWGWNYHLYNDPDRGWLFIPNDLDQAVPAAEDVDFEPLPAREEPATWLFQEDPWRDRWIEVFAGVHDKFDAERFAARIDTYWAQTREAAATDPFLEWDAASDRYADLKIRYQLRRAFLEEWLACVRTSGGGASCP